MTSHILLSEVAIQPIPTSVSIGRLPASDVPGLFNASMSDPDQANMFMRMFFILQALGQRELALDMQAKALASRSFYRVSEPSKPGIRLLALMGPGDMMDNTPFEFVVENADIRLDFLFLMPDQPLSDVIPDHDVAIVALSESDKNRPLLARMDELFALWPRPILNRPEHITRCARDVAYQLLKDVPGLRIPQTQRLVREQECGMSFPITIRPIDTHAGQGFEKLKSNEDFVAYYEAHPEPEFFIAEYFDYRSPDGLFRKYRIVLIDGAPYLCHLAISDHWIVHYVSANMAASEWKRNEEASAMESFDRDFAVRHENAFAAIYEGLGLDYVVLDCGETPDGCLLLFEVDVAGWIHATDPVDVFPYKLKYMQKAFDAFRGLLAKSLA